MKCHIGLGMRRHVITAPSHEARDDGCSLSIWIVRLLQLHSHAAVERVPLTTSRETVWFRDVFPPLALGVHFTSSKNMHDVTRSVMIVSGCAHLLLITYFVVLLLSLVLVQGSADFVYKGPDSKYFYHSLSITTIRLFYCVKLAINSTWRNEQGCVLIKLYLHKRLVWPSGCHVLTPVQTVSSQQQSQKCLLCGFWGWLSPWPPSCSVPMGPLLCASTEGTLRWFFLFLYGHENRLIGAPPIQCYLTSVTSLKGFPGSSVG